MGFIPDFGGKGIHQASGTELATPHRSASGASTWWAEMDTESKKKRAHVCTHTLTQTHQEAGRLGLAWPGWRTYLLFSLERPLEGGGEGTSRGARMAFTPKTPALGRGCGLTVSGQTSTQVGCSHWSYRYLSWKSE